MQIMLNLVFSSENDTYRDTFLTPPPSAVIVCAIHTIHSFIGFIINVNLYLYWNKKDMINTILETVYLPSTHDIVT